MAWGRISLSLASVVVIGLVATACSVGSDDSEGVSIDQPIGAPDTGSSFDEGSSAQATAIDSGPSVVKTASVELDVVTDELSSAAQAVVDMATSSKVGGFLVTSVVDLDEGFGSGNVVVRVPAPHFEEVVGDLETVGDITRQELEGQDLTADFLDTHARLRQARSRLATLLDRLRRNEDPAARLELREDLQTSRDALRRLRQNESFITGQTAYSTIDVALTGKQPPAPPQPPAFERASATAKTIVLAIASGAVLAAGVIVPIGVLLLVLYLVGATIVRRLKPRLES
jgi:Domain of unknown function (DUF4349)